MSQHITVQIREVYGTQLVYPACPKSVLFAGIAKTKTLTMDTLYDIQRLGFEVKVETPTVTVSKRG